MLSTIEPETFQLAKKIDHGALEELFGFLTANRGSPVLIDGSSIRQFGAQGAQILAVACKTWHEDGVLFWIDDPSGAIEDGIMTLGMLNLLSNALETQEGME